MPDQALTNELKELLLRRGAGLVGAADLRGLEGCGYPAGIAVAIPLPPRVIRDLQTAPTAEYHALYHTMNQALNELVLAGEAFLKERGFDAWAQTTGRVKTDASRSTPLPHKTVAVRAGLGWIGKNCLLVTPEYGSAVRLSSLLTNAPLACDAPVTESRCGGCRLCVDACPAQALTGAAWQAGMPRQELVDVEACRAKQLEIMARCTGIQTDLCGKCFAVCAYTQKRMMREDCHA